MVTLVCVFIGSSFDDKAAEPLCDIIKVRREE